MRIQSSGFRDVGRGLRVIDLLQVDDVGVPFDLVQDHLLI